MSLRGVIPPLVTPFRADGTLDLAAFEANVEALTAHDLAGFLVLGSNGEAASLDEEEKRTLVAAGTRPDHSRSNHSVSAAPASTTGDSYVPCVAV